MKKMMKKIKYPQMQNIDDIDSFYENENEEKKDIPKGFKDINEVIFYDDDVDFLRHHKRTKRNMEYVVNKYLIESGKQGIDSGLKENHRIMVTYTMLNKACSLLHVWWDMILFQNDLSPQDVPVDSTKVLDKDNLRDDNLARIQKNLTRAVPFLRSKICQELGLRYAPEIRFYHDKTEEVRKEILEEGGVEQITGVKYDEEEFGAGTAASKYSFYLREIEVFLNFSKLELENYLDRKVSDENQKEMLRELHRDKEQQRDFKDKILQKQKETQESVDILKKNLHAKMALQNKQDDAKTEELPPHELKRLKKRNKIYSKDHKAFGDDLEQRMDAESPTTMEEAFEMSMEVIGDEGMKAIPKNDPVIDPLTGDKRKVSKAVQKGKWRNKKSIRTDRFWTDISAN